MKNWQKDNVQATKDILDSMIKGLFAARSIALELSKAVTEYDGKCWNRKIEKTLQKKIKNDNEWYMFSDYNLQRKFHIAIMIYGIELPYGMNVIYRAENKSLYTVAGNYRISSKDWQKWANEYAKNCYDYIGKLKLDIENIDCLVGEYNSLLEKSEQIANSVQIETRNIIKRTGVFYPPITRLYK